MTLSPQFDFNGQTLNTALNEQPELSLSFYSYGCILRKREGDSISEYPVDPQQVALMLATKVSFDTGLLDPSILAMRQDGAKQTIVGFRKRCKTGIWLEGSETALRLPLPDLVMIRTTIDNKAPQYRVYALKGRPTTLDVELFNCPLPNVFNSGSICWGTVKQVEADGLKSNSLAADWSVLLGSPFGNHALHNKSKSEPSDIRKLLVALEKRNARLYPRRDLISAQTSLAQAIGYES